ncbi:MAG TPA: hypothetical protein VKU80_12910, partial [Planctomycetota bacterium]|nr:hypothetical protein [Planctomycetota bacterium]
MGFFDRLFGLRGEEYSVDPTYRGLRQQALTLDPTTVGISETAGRPVFGFLMDMGYQKAVATLVVIADGTVSLYFSNGGGMIGLGEDEPVRKSAGELLAGVGHFLPHCLPATDFPLPKKGNARFLLLSFGGVRTAEAGESDLGNARLPLSPLFLKSHEVIHF